MYRFIISTLLISLQLPLYAADGDTVPAVLTSVLTPAENPWGRFQPSSWTFTQTVTVQTNAEGKKTGSNSEKKTVLLSVEKDEIVLEETDTVNFGGREIQKAPVIKHYDFFQQPASEKTDDKTAGKTEITAGEPEKLVIDRLLIPCEKRVYQKETPSGKCKTTVWYSSQIYPYIFRVEKIQKQETAEQLPVVISQSVTEVQNLPVLQLRRGRTGSCRYRTIRKSGGITTVIETTCSGNVPGGILKETTREFDQTGREIRFSESRLINYYAAADLPPIGGIIQPEMFIYDKSRLRLQKKTD